MVCCAEHWIHPKVAVSALKIAAVAWTIQAQAGPKNMSRSVGSNSSLGFGSEMNAEGLVFQGQARLKSLTSLAKKNKKRTPHLCSASSIWIIW